MNLKYILERLYSHELLTRAEAGDILMHIAQDGCHPYQVAAFLSVYNMRPVSLQELQGFRDAMMALRLPVTFQPNRVIDLCGTGGDGKDTFNISTLSSLVVAGAGGLVAKHGNKSVSSKCGSSNVLEFLGVPFEVDQEGLSRQLNQAGIAFLHAPYFHPAMKHVAPVRQAMAVKTFFNMLGPLVNPCDPPVQMAGVFNASVARLYYYLLLETDKDFAIIYDLAGFDEISLTGPAKVFTRTGEQLLYPGDFGLKQYPAEALYGGEDVASSAAIFRNVLEGNGTAAQTDVVLANAGLALSVYNNVSLKEGVAMAAASLKEGRALDILHQLTHPQL